MLRNKVDVVRSGLVCVNGKMIPTYDCGNCGNEIRFSQNKHVCMYCNADLNWSKEERFKPKKKVAFVRG